MRSCHLLLFALFGLTSLARAYDSWSSIPQDATRQNLWGIAYDGNNTLVAVGEQGTIIVSNYAGAPWQARACGTAVWLTGVGYGNGRWVAVGELGTVLSSDDDGDTWTARTSGTNARLNAVAYGNNRWLAVGESGTVLTSSDGIVWTVRPSLGTGFFRALAFGQGQFLFGGAGGSLYTTADGSTFTPVSLATTANLESAAISAARCWVVGSDGLLATATQLGTWSFANAGPTTVRSVVAKSAQEASAVGDSNPELTGLGSAQTFEGLKWTSSYPRPAFLCTASVLGKNEIITAGFGGGLARTNAVSNASVKISPGPSPRVIYGRPVLFSAVVSGATATAYQWTREGFDLPGETRPEFQLPAADATGSGYYGVRVTTTAGTVSSASSLLIVPGGRPEVFDAAFQPALPVTPSRVVPQFDGKLLVAGNFSVTPAGGATYGLARLNHDGSLDLAFRAGAGISALSSVYAIHLSRDGRIYVRGNFSAVGGLRRPGLARLLPDGGIDPSFQPPTTLGNFTSSALDSSDRLHVTTPGKVLRLDTGGAAETTFDFSNASLVGIDTQGRIILSRFYRPALLSTFEYGGPALYRFFADGTGDSSYAFSYFEGGTPVVIAGDDVLGVASSGGRFGRAYFFRKITDTGAIDSNYARKMPMSPYPAGIWNYAFRPDGGAWVYNPGYQTLYANDNLSYAADGTPEPARYANPPEKTDYIVLATEPDGSLLVEPNRYLTGSSNSSPPVLARVVPITGRLGRLTNLSVRAYVSSAADPLIVGFVTSGTGTTRALARAIGPGLTPFGVTDAMTDPRLALARDGAVQATNDNWDSALSSRFSSIGAFALPNGSKDAALESSITTGNYTLVVTPAPGAPGTALAELYESSESTPAPRRFVNVSARSRVDPARPLIVGFSITGEVPATVLIRGIGPTLSAFAVSDALADPRLKLHRGSTAIWENDNWAGSTADIPVLTAAATKAGAFPLGPTSKDAAMLVTLAPGSYTAVVTAPANTSGTALVEVYETQ